EQQQKKQKLMTTVASPSMVTTTVASPATVPQDWLDELTRIQQSVAQLGRPSFIFGRFFKFRKGDWAFIGGEKEKIPDRSGWSGMMTEPRHGWRKFVVVTTEDGDIKSVPEYRVGKISEGWEVPPRESLGDMDQSKWKIGLNNKIEDPWKRVGT